MSFGHGPDRKTHDYRAIPLAVGDCTEVKRKGLAANPAWRS
jgi:hypothetical protein